MDTLRTLLVALLVTGMLALLIAALGGLFLAARALDPVRLAFRRQQTFIADAAHELRTPLTLLARTRTSSYAPTTACRRRMPRS